jgi:hypothetical protein
MVNEGEKLSTTKFRMLKRKVGKAQAMWSALGRCDEYAAKRQQMNRKVMADSWCHCFNGGASVLRTSRNVRSRYCREVYINNSNQIQYPEIQLFSAFLFSRPFGPRRIQGLPWTRERTRLPASHSIATHLASREIHF